MVGATFTQFKDVMNMAPIEMGWRLAILAQSAVTFKDVTALPCLTLPHHAGPQHTEPKHAQPNLSQPKLATSTNTIIVLRCT